MSRRNEFEEGNLRFRRSLFQWDVEELRRLDEMLLNAPALREESSDRLRWDADASGFFSVATAYKWYVFEESNESECPENKGKHPINLFIILMKDQHPGEGGLVDIKRGGTEITINHSKALIC
ncbi:hypothetical protein LOK49_LG10G01743 [Camellia lanceoleosa]|uniref:Uncharacterized protein n=1 Tax=Camellia lanceoleosa TaxID=1840588 RepID=A0ACC0G731_9ERIC|nr:hypothetical protein LOK49_LG10G01743 [Camellia lanceoleosa]